MRRSGAAAVCKNDRALQRRKETKGIYHEETLLDHSLHCLNSEATMIMCLSESIESKEKRTPALYTHTQQQSLTSTTEMALCQRLLQFAL